VICLEIKILESRGPVLRFLVEGTNPAFANSLRRIMIAEIPTLAIEWIDVHDNNSGLFDEFLSHRMGLIPLRFDPKKFNLPGECSCKGKGCPLCQVVFVIDKKGPGLVTAGDMNSSDKSVKPMAPNIPIVELLEWQKIKLEAVARLGIGKDHARHHAANASYQYYPVISVKGSKADLQKAVKACPKGVLSVKGGKLVLDDSARCDLCRSCMEGIEGIEVTGDESRIIFSVESVSGLEPEHIVASAAGVLQEKAEEFRKKLDKI